ncbi:MAG: hypothetical protein R3F22_09710 [Lysobacteraceae bacterium]
MNVAGDLSPARGVRPKPVSRLRSPALLLGAAVLLVPGVHAGALPVDVFNDGFEPTCATLLYEESFDADGGSWPTPWIELADSAAVADVVGGEARLQPVPTGNPYPLARMFADIHTLNVDVRYRIRMESAARNGIGFYVRQNGGHMLNTDPTGSGYVAFVEGGFRGQPGIGLWREENGIEVNFAHSAPGLLDPQADVDYEVRFQVEQFDATTTLLRARMWPSGEVEPGIWHVEAGDTQADLQGVIGGMAIDVWDSNVNHPDPAHGFIDDIEVRAFCPPS